MLKVENLVKSYGNQTVLKDLSFTLEEGEILGLLGPNGAGKSTTMNILTGYISASSGNVFIDGHDIVDEGDKIKGKIGYLPELPPLYTDMTVEEYLHFVCELKKVPKKEIKETLDEVMESVNILNVRGRLIKNLSKGYKQRVGIAQAIIGNPEIIIFDEPTVGLDPKEIVEIRKLIRNIGKNRTVILSSHILSEVEEICHKLLIINKGEMVAMGTKDELQKKLSEGNKIVIRVKGDDSPIINVLKSIPSLSDFTPLGSLEEGCLDFEIEVKENQDIREELFFKLSKNKLPLLMLHKNNLDLENLFLQITK